jgi:hypothetical protein
MKLAASVLVSVALVLASERVAYACAGCSNPNLPTARAANTALAAGAVSATLNLTMTTMHVVHAESCPVS